MNFKEFTLNYFENINTLLNDLDLNEFEKFYNLLKEHENKIYIIGNGGSSSTASHMANDLSIGLKRRDKKKLDAQSLSDNNAISFAIANDIGFENVFYMQLKDIIKPKDIVIAISCSGNSPNIIKAVEYSKKIGSTVVGFTGFDGGKLYNMSDINLHIKTQKDEYGLVEDIHLILNHIIFTYMQRY